jgi:hypothetical protein
LATGFHVGFVQLLAVGAHLLVRHLHGVGAVLEHFQMHVLRPLAIDPGVSASSGSLPVAPWQVSQRSLASLPCATSFGVGLLHDGNPGQLGVMAWRGGQFLVAVALEVTPMVAE